MRTTAQIAKSGVVALGGFTCRPARYYPGSVGIRIAWAFDSWQRKKYVGTSSTRLVVNRYRLARLDETICLISERRSLMV